MSTVIHSSSFTSATVHPWLGAVLAICCLVTSCKREQKENINLSSTGPMQMDPASDTMALSEFTSCSQLLSWRQKNLGLFHSRKSVKGWDISVEYRSPYCIACLEQPHARSTDQELHTRLAELDSTFQLIVRSTSRSEAEDTAGADVLQQNTKLILSGDTLDCAFSHMEPTPEMVPYRTHILGFLSQTPREGSFTVKIGPGFTSFDWSFEFSGSLRTYLQAAERTRSND